MTPSGICEVLRRELGSLFSCEYINQNIRIRTPYLYPDGEVIDLEYSRRVEGWVLTDFGDTIAWLWNQGMPDRRSPRQQRMLNDICFSLGVSFERGELMVCAEGGEIADAITRLAQAALRVADLWYLSRYHVRGPAPSGVVPPPLRRGNG